MPKSPPHTPSKRNPAALFSSPYLAARITPSRYFSSGTTALDTRLVEEDASEDEESAAEDGFPPYNTYWGAVVRAAHAKPQLIQAEVAHDWWKVLVAVMLLNKTTGKAAIPVFRDLMVRWPNPASMAEAPMSLLTELLRPLGLYNVRAQRIIALSIKYMEDPPSLDKPRKSRVPGYPATAVSHLPGCGRYALDSFRIFCCPGQEWMMVMPMDKELIKYLRWKWAIVGCRKWDPVYGVVGYDDEEYLVSLCEPSSKFEPL